MKIRRVAMAAAAAVALACSATGTAQASTPIYQWHFWSSGICLDSNSNGDVYGNSCNGGSYQRWSQSNDWGAYLFKDVETGRYLGEGLYGHLYASTDHSEGDEHWYLVGDGIGHYAFKNYATGDCIDNEGTTAPTDATPCGGPGDHFQELWHTS
ncbi:hypothetical protein ABH920_008559 [Catenulispora sp. EB89]|uniref:RICIN domain-containing protein n=1 Tax=Catenulispora sp. EB89 TaxID=3156257 RepID=UPI0035151F79